ncbi:MAG: murein biosynthesis integral membrane protein MurJ [Chloroflexota bacterium]
MNETHSATQQQTEQFGSGDRTKHMLQSSFWVMLISGVSKLTGFVKLLLLTQFFGAGAEADAFTSANQLPELFFTMLAGGALGAAIIPVYSAYLTGNQRGNAARLSNTIFTLITLALVLFCSVAAYYAPWIIRTILVPHFLPEQQMLTANLMRILLAATVVFGMGNIIASILNAHQHFILPALGMVALDIGQVLGIYFLAPRIGIQSSAWGVFFGACMLFLMQIPALVRHRIGYRPQMDLGLDGTREVLTLMGPRIITLGVIQAVDIIFIRLASGLPDGSISAYFYALLTMVFMPRSLFSAAIAVVILPTTSEQYNTGRREDVMRTISHSLQTAWVLIIPAAVGLITLGQPAVSFLFERGEFTAEASALVYTIMAIMSLRLLSQATQDVLSVPFYSHHNTTLPMYANIAWTILNIALCYALIPFGIIGLTWATTIAEIFLALALFALLRWYIGKLDERMLLIGLMRITIACLVMSGVIYAIRQLEMGILPYLASGMGLGLLTYVGVYVALGGKELHMLWRIWQDRTN